jgi:hypothetical protein
LEAFWRGEISMARDRIRALFLFVLFGAATTAHAQVQPQVAQRYFAEARASCERDAGRLWGVSLCGPLVIFDQRTDTRATNQPEPEGPLPRFPSGADGPVMWGGVRWFAIPLFLLPENDPDLCQQVILHGLFHRIQPELGLITGDGTNEHLDSLEGRIWMQLEWRALRRAVESTGNTRIAAVSDALAFRRERRRLFPGAAEGERREEIREGLPSYTGIAAWAKAPADAHRAAAIALAGGEAQTSFVGNFEAASGPAYGVLLDDLSPGWRRQVRATSDLGDMLASAINRPATPNVTAAAARYDGAALRTKEEARDRAQQLRVAELRRRFVDGPVLTMPAAGSGTSNTLGSVVIPGAGTVFFQTFTQSGQWGRLTASTGVLRASDGTTLSVPITAPLTGTTLQGDGWSVTLNAGWVVRPAARAGSFVIVRAPYSPLTTRTGSRRRARTTGGNAATIVATPSTARGVASATTSVEVTSKRSDATRRPNATPPAMPSAAPHATSAIMTSVTFAITWAARAPSASRMPISR